MNKKTTRKILRLGNPIRGISYAITIPKEFMHNNKLSPGDEVPIFF